VTTPKSKNFKKSTAFLWFHIVVIDARSAIPFVDSQKLQNRSIQYFKYLLKNYQFFHIRDCELEIIVHFAFINIFSGEWWSLRSPICSSSSVWEFTKLLMQICKIFCNFKVLSQSCYSTIVWPENVNKCHFRNSHLEL